MGQLADTLKKICVANGFICEDYGPGLFRAKPKVGYPLLKIAVTDDQIVLVTPDSGQENKSRSRVEFSEGGGRYAMTTDAAGIKEFESLIDQYGWNLGHIGQAVMKLTVRLAKKAVKGTLIITGSDAGETWTPIYNNNSHRRVTGYVIHAALGWRHQKATYYSNSATGSMDEWHRSDPAIFTLMLKEVRNDYVKRRVIRQINLNDPAFIDQMTEFINSFVAAAKYASSPSEPVPSAE